MIVIGGSGTVSPLEPLAPITLVVEAPTATEDISIFNTRAAVTINRITVVCTGSTPSVTWNLFHDTDRNASGTKVFTSDQTSTSTGSGNTYTVFNNPNIPLDSFLWFETSAASGTNVIMQLTMFFS